MDIKEFLKVSRMGDTLLSALMASILLSACGGEAIDVSPAQAPTEVESLAPPPPQSASDSPAPIPSDASVEPLLSGETLARYRALPPEFRTALDAYVWFGVPARLAPAAARDKIDQWGEWALPLERILGDDRAASLRMEARRGGEPPKERYANLLLSGYVYAIQTEASVEGRRELMSFLAFGPHTGDPGEQSTDEQSPEDPRDPREGIVVFLVDHPPPIASIVTATALERLEDIGPHAKQELLHPQTTSPNVSNPGPTDAREVVQWLTLQEMFLLKAQPGSDIPPIEDHLSGEAIAKFQSLSGVGKSQARKLYRQHAVYQVVASGADPIVMEAWDLGGVAAYAIAAAGQ